MKTQKITNNAITISKEGHVMMSDPKLADVLKDGDGDTPKCPPPKHPKETLEIPDIGCPPIMDYLCPEPPKPNELCVPPM